MPRTINNVGLDILKEFEAGPQGNCQPALRAYLCPAGKWTIGWGHTLGVKEGQVISREYAEDILRLDLADSCKAVEAAVDNGRTSSNEFSALVLLHFNIGHAAFMGSSPLRLHKAGKKTEAANAFALWRKCTDPKTGQIVDSPGLIRRRAAEAALYLKAEFRDQAMPQAVAPEKSPVVSKTVLTAGAGIVAGAGSVVDQVSTMKGVVDQATAAMTSMGAFKAAMSGMFTGKGLSVVLGTVAVVCIAVVLGRYILKVRRGEVSVR